jgi:hypothetical protein
MEAFRDISTARCRSVSSANAVPGTLLQAQHERFPEKKKPPKGGFLNST